MSEILIGSAIFTLLVMVLGLIVIGARRLLMPQGMARLTVNRENVIDAALGEKLLGALEHGGIHLPTSCSGAGTCGLCRLQVSGTNEVLPVERGKLTQADISAGFRLACQVVVRNDLDVIVSTDLLAAETWSCTVKGSRTVAPLIKEILLALPAGYGRTFTAGSFVQVTAPPYRLDFTDIAVEPEHEEAWRRRGLRLAVARLQRDWVAGVRDVRDVGDVRGVPTRPPIRLRLGDGDRGEALEAEAIRTRGGNS